MIIIIIITLFKEDNIFGRYASLTYGPQLTNIEVKIFLTFSLGYDLKLWDF